DSPQPGGLSADAVAKICKLAMQQDAAGKLTDEALLTWLREVYLPPIRGQGPDDGSTSETSPVVACMLMSDLVPADLFEQLVEAWVRRVPQMTYCTECEHVLLGLVYSRHTTSRHVGQ